MNRYKLNSQINDVKALLKGTYLKRLFRKNVFRIWLKPIRRLMK